MTLKPASRAPLDVETTQHSLCMPKVTISVMSSAFSLSARSGFDSKVFSGEKSAVHSLVHHMSPQMLEARYGRVVFATRRSS